ncbi:LytR/AlgR family response regulator transcription factor [Leuconostoc fallax]|uniref:Response regulatory domain-containing protein n=1 Tax=Leuconostoc fallax TaxID=1251 RepID=A0A4R5NBZ0_9LACO|nr:response regulator transcription factor [Leuconostoc fallax]MBU7456082.1 response regulator transcription factor [Leuconostoc fallax]TDG70121.1 hypothetical protein C5L23_001645 [Leuconostoc fallax]
MNIYLLEDNLQQQKRIQYLIEHTEYAAPLTLNRFDNPSALLKALKNEAKPTIVLLDLEIKDIVHAGLSTAKAIRQYDSQSQIIIVTTHQELAIETYRYQIGVLDFIDKSGPESNFKQQLNEAISVALNHLELMSQREPVWLHLTQHPHLKFDLNDILYIASIPNSHNIEIHTTTRIYQLRANLKDCCQLHDDLLRVHAGYIINKYHAHYYNTQNKTMLMSNQDEVPVSRRYTKMAKSI